MSTLFFGAAIGFLVNVATTDEFKWTSPVQGKATGDWHEKEVDAFGRRGWATACRQWSEVRWSVSTQRVPYDGTSGRG